MDEGDIKTKDVRSVVASLDGIVKYYREVYNSEDKKEKRDWRTYRQQKTHRMRRAARELKGLVHKAAKDLEIIKDNNRGAKPILDPEEKTLLLLLKEIFKLSNRDMSDMLFFFNVMSGEDVSYKTIERIYSDEVVCLILHNMFVLLLKEKKIDSADMCGDGTGYSLSVKKSYRDENDKEKDRKDFVYYFSLLDLGTLMYVCCGYSRKSEKDAYNKALKMLKDMGIAARSVRLDRYYSNHSVTEDFDKNTTIYIIPKKNVTVKGSLKWKKILCDFALNTYAFLKEYFKRNLSEAMFSVDQRFFGGYVRQKLDERIEQCVFARSVLHNLFFAFG